jgi:glycosyltransferase involved in cell wall biosynthesis
MTLVSVVVNNHNYERFLREAIESALAQTHPGTEVVVVDDGSTDASRDVIAAYGGRVVPVLKPNGGQASAFNAGIRASRGDVVIFLDADDLLAPTAAARAAERLADPGVVKVHWPLRMIDEHGRPTGALMPDEPLPEGDFRDVLIETGPDSYLSMPTSGNAWARRVLERLHPLPEPDYRQGADGYLLTMTPLFGPVRRVAEPQGCYRVHGANQFWTGALDQRVERSLLRYDRRARSLADHLRAEGVAVDAERWKRRNPYYQWMRRVREAVGDLRALVPPGARFVLVDGDEWGARVLHDRVAVPFLERDGQYWGPPPDDAAAVAEVERQRRAGATHLVVGWPAFWWLDHYAAFHRHLRATFPRVLANDRLVAFDLRG